MQCPYCGNDNPDGALSCQRCGLALPVAPRAAPSAAPSWPAEASVPTRPRRNLFIGLAVVLVLLGVVLAAGQLVAVREGLQRLRTRALPGPVATQAARHLQRGTALMEAGQLQEAERELKRATELAPQAPETWVQLGICQYQLGDLDGSIASYRKALEQDPNHWVAHDNLAYDLYDKGQVQEAVQHWERATLAAPQEADCWAGLAIGQLALGKRQAAIAAYEQAVGLDSRYLDPQYMKTEALWSEKALEQAKELMAAVQASPHAAPTPPRDTGEPEGLRI